MHEISIVIIILIHRKLGLVGSVQQKIKLPLPNNKKISWKSHWSE